VERHCDGAWPASRRARIPRAAPSFNGTAGEAELSDRRLRCWIPWWDAYVELADIFEARGFEVEPAHHEARRSLMQQLVEGALPARPDDRSNFSLHFSSGEEQTEISLTDHGWVPATFWYYFHQAKNEDELRNHATESWDKHHCRFQLHVAVGLKNGGELIGYVEGLELLRERIDGLPRRRGERGKKYALEDAVATRRAIEAIKSGEDRDKAIARFAADLPGASLDSRKRRLRLHVKNAGF